MNGARNHVGPRPHKYGAKISYASERVAEDIDPYRFDFLSV